jgi:hypothetical protein
VGGAPTSAGGGHSRMRFSHRRHALLEALLRAVLHRVGDSPCPTRLITTNPHSRWMTQQARNLLMQLDDDGIRPRFLVRDRDSKFSREFDEVFRSEGIRVIKAPVRAPNGARPCRALGRERPSGVSRPAVDSWPPPSPACARGVRLAFQRASAAPCNSGSGRRSRGSTTRRRDRSRMPTPP